ncbi:hypothetical protein BDV96DRAFT_689015 [Lophiotrema nucula]|uniref:Cupredoxin n=1 Tax=Lophiotrema nucula TaxID=690887 RepID=A0A6A5Z386_9PLEO|nr:hypothetical protein BDV96DRAFT_689015 [Lophiotrema nucula]
MAKPLSRITLAGLALLSLSAVGYGQTAERVSTTATTTARPSTTATTTSPASAKTHTVQVGKGDHTFKPDVTKADVGDIVEFQFFPANHSVVRAEYEYPCIPIDTLSPADADISFFSGFHPVSSILDDPPTWRVRVNDTKPIFFYCSAPDSCIKYGMVGVINPSKSSDLDHQQGLAKHAGYMLQPGEPFPAEGTPTVPPSSLPSDPSAVPIPKSGGKHLSPGVIAGIVIAGVFVFVLGALLFFFIGRTRTLEDEAERKDSTIVHRTPMTPTASSHFSNPFTGGGTGAMHERMPPAYFGGVELKTPASQVQSSRVSSSACHRSTGGTFDLSPMGVYQRTHEEDDTYKMATSSDFAQNESPVLGGWGQVSFGPQPFGVRQNQNGFAPSPHVSPRARGAAAPSYFERQQTELVEADGREIPRMF